MKKRTAVLLLAALMILALFSGCAKSESMDYFYTGSATTAPSVSVDSSESYFSGSTGSVKEEADYDSGVIADDMASADAGDPGSAETPEEDRKRIFYGSVEIETMEFDQAIANLEAIVAQLGGYFDKTDLSGSSLYDYGYSRRYASFTVKIPSKYFNTFLGNAGEIGNVVNTSTWSEDITMAYYDLQTRLETQNTKKDRLMDLLAKATEMTDIIELENALSDTIYEIESLTSTLQRYDNLIDYSTITVNVSEVIKETNVREVPKTLGERIAAQFDETWEELVEFFEDFTVWFIGGTPVIVLLLILVLLIWLIIRLCIRSYRKRINRRAAAQQAVLAQQGDQIPPQQDETK